MKNAVVGGALLARLIAERAVEHASKGADRFLDSEEVGAMIGKSKSWVEKNAEALPKRRKVGGEGVCSY